MCSWLNAPLLILLEMSSFPVNLHLFIPIIRPKKPTNKTPTVFLRELEYFQGIIFLTTNLYSTIDVAFRSRVHIHLLFDPLSFSSRRLLWEKFLARLPAAELPPAQSDDPQGGIGKDALTELAKWDLNGREIKNSIKTVRTWCVCKGVGLNLSRLESGIRVTAPQARKVEGEA